MELQRKVALQGTIIDAETDEAIVGAVVTLTGPTDPDNNPVTTTDDGNVDDGTNAVGTYRFEGLLPGRYRLEVVHAGHIKQVIELGKLSAGEDVEQNVLMVPLPVAGDGGMFELPPEVGRISGVAQKSGELARPDDEQDHSGITVEVEDSGLRTVTNRRGHFDLFLNAGTYNLVLSTPDHHLTRREDIAVAESEEVTLDEPIVMEPNPGTINGLVLLEGAAGDENAGITVTLANTSLTAQTDDSGAYQLTEVPAGVYTIRALKEGYDEASTSGVVVRGGRDTEALAMALPISRGSIQGMVGLAAAQSNQGIAINLENTGFGTFTNAAGTYRVDGIPLGQYTVQACKQGYEPTTFANVEVTANGVTTAPRPDEPSELARQQVRVTEDGVALTTNAFDYRLRFAEVPAWVNAVRVSGVSQNDLADGQPNDFRPYDAEQEGVDLQLSPGDGVKQLNVQFRGDGCYLSDVFQVAITVDQTGPDLSNLRLVGALETEGGLLTNQLDLTLQAQIGDATEIQVRGDLASAGGEAANLDRWITASHSLAIRLDEADGVKEVSIGARDEAGNLARPTPTLTALIRLDRTPPENAAIRIVDAGGIPLEDGSVITNPRVSLQLNAQGAHEMQVADDAAFTNAIWLPMQPTTERPVPALNEDGMKTIFARFRDQAGNTTNAVSTRVRLDRLGQIRGTVNSGCGEADLTAVRIFVDGVPQGSPGPDGRFMLRDVPIGDHRVSAQLEGYDASDPIDVTVDPEATDRDADFDLTNRFGKLSYTVSPERSRTCASIEVLIDGVAEDAPRQGCAFEHGQLTTGFHQLKLQRPGFEDAIELVNIPSCGTLVLGEVTLERATGTATGVVRLQSQGDSGNADTIISFRAIAPVEDDAITVDEFCAAWDACGYQQDCAQRFTNLNNKDYRRIECFFEAMTECVRPLQELVNACPDHGAETELTDTSGSFTHELQVGHYAVSAEHEGFSKKELGTFTIIANGVTAITPDGLATLSQQTGDFDINGGAAFTRSRDVTLSMEFNDVVGFKFRVNGGDFPRGAPIEWQDPDADAVMEFDLRLNGADGVKRIEIMTIDVDGVESGAPYYNASITLDTQAPENGELSIDSGAQYTNSRNQNVTLTLNASDENGVDRVILTHLQNCPNPDGARAYSPLLNYQLNGDSDGLKRVTACFVDPAGNVSAPVSASITLDRIAPNIQAFGVRDFAGQACANGCVVNTREISLLLTEDGRDTREVWITRDDPTFTTGAWQPKLPGPIEFTLPREAADYDIYLKAKDAAGNVVGDTEATRLQVSIRLDNEAPAAPNATTDKTWLNDKRFRVNFTNIAGVATIEMSPNINFPRQNVESQDANGTVDYELGPAVPQGPLTRYVRYVDDAGNEGPATALELVFDNEAPTLISAQVGFGDPNEIAYINNRIDVPIQSLCTDNLASNRELDLSLSRGQAVIDVPYSPLVFLEQVPAVEGASQFEVRCTDAAGNISEPQTITYTLDSTPPNSGDSIVIVANGQAYTRSRTVAVDIEAEDNLGGSGIRHMAVGESGQVECATANYQAFAPSTTVTLPAEDGAYTIRVCLKDAAGNAPAVITTDIILDTTAPNGDFVFGAQDGASQSHSKSRRIRLRASSADATKMARQKGIPDCDSIPVRNRVNFFTDQVIELNLQTEGLHSVSLCIYDDAGNSTRITKQITVDETQPTGNMDINRGAQATNSREVTINLSAAADVTHMHVKEVNGAQEARGFDCSAVADDELIPLDLAHDYTLEDGDGVKRVVVCLKDAAGWTIKLPNTVEGNYTAALITLDSTGPNLGPINPGGAMGVLIKGGASLTNNPELRVRLRASDTTTRVSQYKLSGNDACTGGTWQDWSAIGEQGAERSTTFAVNDGDNERRDVSVIFRDEVGNESACATDDITVDTVPLTLSRFIIAGQAGDSPGYTSSSDILVTDIATSGAGDCARYEFGENPNFVPRIEISANAGTCPIAESGNGARPPLEYQLIFQVNGPKTVYARVRDAAGNYSATLSATIELDGERPTLTGVTVQKNPDAIPDGPDNNGNVLPIYLSSRDVIVQPQEPGGGARMRYEMLENGNNDCATAANLPNEIDYVGPFSIRFDSDGPKRVCLVIDDEVGNFSTRREVLFFIDTLPPPAPALPNGNLAGVNASCAYVKTRRAENDRFWKFQFRSAGGIWRDLTDDVQKQSDLFNPGQPNDVAYIQFDLTQDTDNLLQVRAVDYAGNVSEASQVIVEEVSSRIIPTDLHMKQQCNDGQYAILKQPTEGVNSARRSNCFGNFVEFYGSPQIAVLDMERLTMRRLTDNLGIDDLSGDPEACLEISIESSLMDAACSPRDGQSALLLARPKLGDPPPRGGFSATCPMNPWEHCQSGGIGGDNEPMSMGGNIPDLDMSRSGGTELVVMPDPIGDPNQPIVTLSELRNVSGFDMEDCDDECPIARYPVRTIDVLDWRGNPSTGNYTFDAISTDVEKVYSPPEVPNGVMELSWRTNIRRIGTQNGIITAEATPIASVAGLDNFNIRGLAFGDDNNVHFLKFDPAAPDPDDPERTLARWRTFLDTIGELAAPTELETPTLTDPNISPFRNRIGPSHYKHTQRAPESRNNMIYIDEEGRAQAHRVDTLANVPNPETSPRVFRTLGLGAPENAAFFELGLNQARWVDADDPRTVYRSRIYGENPSRLRYAVDTGLPIFPALGSNFALGSPGFIYHTTGVTTGIVIVYLDENDTDADECAE